MTTALTGDISVEEAIANARKAADSETANATAGSDRQNAVVQRTGQGHTSL